MNTSNTQTTENVAALTKDVMTSVLIVSLTTNVTIFVAWLAVALR
jgi:hypothetical protein